MKGLPVHPLGTTRFLAPCQDGVYIFWAQTLYYEVFTFYKYKSSDIINRAQANLQPKNCGYNIWQNTPVLNDVTAILVKTIKEITPQPPPPPFPHTKSTGNTTAILTGECQQEWFYLTSSVIQKDSCKELKLIFTKTWCNILQARNYRQTRTETLLRFSQVCGSEDVLKSCLLLF